MYRYFLSDDAHCSIYDGSGRIDKLRPGKPRVYKIERKRGEL
jgi:hypothetical protein